MSTEEKDNIEVSIEENEPQIEPGDEQVSDEAVADVDEQQTELPLEQNTEDDAEQTPQEQPEPEEQTPIFAEPDEPIETTIESVVEAVLFASDEPVSPTRLASIVETTTKEIKDAIKVLNEKYKSGNHAFKIEQIAGGFQILTLSPYNTWLQKLVKVRSDSKLSSAALETLAIIAYKQPIIRADIEAVRGVAAGEMIRSLMYKGLVKITGRAEILGRPMLYGTTKKFLEVFGLNTLKDLPKIEELKKPE
jgi:segregation and condensation protein B